MKPENLHGILGHGVPDGAGEGGGQGQKGVIFLIWKSFYWPQKVISKTNHT